ncbi:uncharacterized protein MYCGRDRAFT_84937 [Zymoseptoria tritici IPO323]|uniref:Uncharacterized protein n=1 Tax=Zymoseptoria tritici (strain CBS 115943 / IPO323) TaxID=336722 RepID=F9X5B9_ZYMTI|nr:uncharacterized protein MYCGRDRAFT_84937 [Zymoseptoria tritici IPO323]EGP89654.1 hypothetical protein MYCGRDRAFT_84937 [Zymoseptoria tritici IPO323]
MKAPDQIIEQKACGNLVSLPDCCCHVIVTRSERHCLPLAPSSGYRRPWNSVTLTSSNRAVTFYLGSLECPQR